MNVRRTHRPGLTLTESLVALFVMALGLLSLLTLFPLGALQIGQALKDDRCGQTALQADGYLRAYWQKNVVESSIEGNGGIATALGSPGMGLTSLGGAITGASNASPIEITSANHGLATGASVTIIGVGGNSAALGTYTITSTATDKFTLDGSTGNGAYTTGGFWYKPANALESSYPVLIDPLGANSSYPGTIAGATGNPISRKGLTLVSSGLMSLQVSCLLDDLTFGTNDRPEAGGWQARYNWSAVVQLPSIDQPETANISVLVFDQRTPLLGPPGVTKPEIAATTVADAATGTSTITPGVTSSLSVTVPAGDTDAIYIRKGGWLMDGTVNGTQRNAFFYRIVGVTSNGTNSYTLDLETPIKTPLNGSSAAYAPSIYFFAGLAEVFERPKLKNIYAP